MIFSFFSGKLTGKPIDSNSGFVAYRMEAIALTVQNIFWVIIAAAAGSLSSESVQGTGYGKRPFRGFPLIIDVSVVLALPLYRLVWTL